MLRNTTRSPREEPAAGEANGNFRGKVLIVEDEFLVALQLEDIIMDEGYRLVGTIPDTASLASICEAPDIALVDLNLRDGLSGPEIARHLAETYAAKVVYVTANPGQIDKPAETAIGIVHKPFSRAAIVEAVRFALNGSGGWPPDLEPFGKTVSG